MLRRQRGMVWYNIPLDTLRQRAKPGKIKARPVQTARTIIMFHNTVAHRQFSQYFPSSRPTSHLRCVGSTRSLQRCLQTGQDSRPSLAKTTKGFASNQKNFYWAASATAARCILHVDNKETNVHSTHFRQQEGPHQGSKKPRFF